MRRFFLFPNVTNATVTLIAGNTSAWSNWAEVVDNNTVTLSSKFAAKIGYISDMYIFDYSAVDKLYLIEIAYGASKVTLGRVMFNSGSAAPAAVLMSPIKSRRVPLGETIYYRMMSSGANGSTTQIGFRYFYE